MKLAVIGATGWLGGAIAREALARGHEVTAVGRDAEKLAALAGMTGVVADATDSESLAAAIAGHDVAVLSVTDRSGSERSVIPRATQTLIEALPAAGVPRLAMMGGGGSLLNSSGDRLVDQPGFPEEYRTEALAGAEALALLRATPETLDWTYLSPPPADLRPGEKRGGYIIRGDDHPATDAAGHSAIASGDLAAAMVDELEHPQFTRRRFTAAYGS
ncbi:MAG: NAD(P)-dependent oxidoreductase [Solirubrobacteraceae bacterium]